MTNLDTAVSNLNNRISGLDNYADIIDNLKKINVADGDKAEEFQRKFTGFFKVRRNADWRKFYYGLLEKNKNNSDVTFESILRSIYDVTRRVEASFSSKMLAVIDPDMPIWDSIVLSKIRIIKPSKNPNSDKRLEETIKKYNELIKWYKDFKYTDAFVKKFDTSFSKYKDSFSTVKKIDFLIWASGDTDPFDDKVYNNELSNT